MSKLLIEQSSQCCKLVVLEENNLRHFQIVWSHQWPQKDRIYRGRVLSYNPIMQSALLDAGDCELYLKTKEKQKVGDELLVQITSEESGKRARATTDITLGGEFVVLLLQGKGIKCSKKTANHKLVQKLMEQLCAEFENEIKDFGILLRSKSDIEHLEDVKDEIRALAAKIPALLSEGIGLKYDAFDKEKIIAELVERYHVTEVLSNEHRISDGLKKYFREKNIDYHYDKVFVLDGQGIVMSQFLKTEYVFEECSLHVNFLEALCVIDVNAPFLRYDALREQKILQTNQIAFEKSMQLIEQFGLSGIVMIDFITMKKKEQAILEEFIAKMLYNRKKHITSCQMTESSLLQLIISRTKQNIITSIAQTCPSCQGSGKILSNAMMLDDFEIRLLGSGIDFENRMLQIEVPIHFDEDDIANLKKVLEKYNIRFEINSQPKNEIGFRQAEKYP